MTLPQDEREGYIIALSIRTGNDESYYASMDDRQLIEYFDRYFLRE